MFKVYEVTEERKVLKAEFNNEDMAAEFIEDCAQDDVEEILGMTSEDDEFFDEVDEFKDMYIVEEV